MFLKIVTLAEGVPVGLFLAVVYAKLPLKHKSDDTVNVMLPLNHK